jgi:hypothetical protein
MKDFTSTAFGLIIAFILPGLLALITCSFWSTRIQLQFDAFTKAQSNGGLFFVVALLALLMGIELSAIRWALFEELICRKIRLRPDEFGALKDDKTAAAFRITIDEHYRYHQFCGGLSPVIPVFFVGFLITQRIAFSSGAGLLFLSFGALLEAVTVAAAIDTYKRYVYRTRELFKTSGQPRLARKKAHALRKVRRHRAG